MSIAFKKSSGNNSRFSHIALKRR